MKAIRGATTVASDNAESIRSAVKELLNEIVALNKLKREQIICIMFSSTSDIKSFYPAKAARECGYSLCPLYSSLEPDIEGSLAKCIRVMVLADGNFAPEHVYLNGAKILRRDISQIINIAVDGPAGSGKSTICRMVAARMGILHLDTGAMYRALALKCVRENADYAEKDAVKHITNKLNLKIEYENGKQKTVLDGEDVSELIRTPQVSLLASYVSAYSFVRQKMVSLQRELAKRTSCILDGRDIGTNVLPDCKFKFYLTATPEIRAKRRLEQDILNGSPRTYEEVLNEINERDFQDKNRAVAPLMQAPDAVVVDTSDMSLEQVAQSLIDNIQQKI